MARFLASLLVAVMVIAPCAIAMPTLASANAIIASTHAARAAAADHEAAPCEEPAHGVDNHCGTSCQNWSTAKSVPVQPDKLIYSVGVDWAVAPGQFAVWHLFAEYPREITRPPDTDDSRASNFSAIFARTGRLHL